MTIIVSFTGFGYSAGFDVSAGMLIVQTLSAHYPERLKRIVMTNTPFVFNAFWALVKVFLDARTSEKVLFCKQEEIPAKLGLPLEQLPPFLGGTSSYVYDPAHVLGSDGAGKDSTYLSVTAGPMAHLPADTLERAWEGLKEEAAAGGGAGATAP
jgi:pimeloyl-ACP methyl ester carboxylesterase